ncbi:MAG: LuxR family transcriptional regulator [Parvularculaceae bacterium]|nr:LuxR family transcriptional regulator [Parvularculaceae bacterium]
MRARLRRFLDEAAAINDSDALLKSFRDILREIGFTVSSYHVLSSEFRKLPFDDGARYVAFPEDWVRRYIDANYFDADPIMATARRVGAPFRWSDLAAFHELSGREKEFLSDLRAAGLDSGFAVPVTSASGDAAYFGVGGVGHDFKGTPGALAELELLCQHLHVRFEALESARRDVALSPRETEVLSLIARGKSNSVIADIIGISSNTVDAVVRRCFEKLGTDNRVEAVLKAASRRLILA